MLHTVIFESSDITDKHIPLLVQAHWPNVQNLTLAGYFEHMEGLDMCMCKWPSLQTLKLGMVTDQTNVWMFQHGQRQMAFTGSSAHLKHIDISQG